MGFNFRKSIKIMPGLTLNLGKKSSSISIGPRGAKLNINSKGKKRLTTSIPGTGLSYTQNIGSNTSRKKSKIEDIPTYIDEVPPTTISTKPIKEKWYFNTWMFVLFLLIGIFIPWFNFFTIFLAFIRDNNIYSRLNKEIEDKVLETQLLCDEMFTNAQSESKRVIDEAKDEIKNLEKIKIDKEQLLAEAQEYVIHNLDGNIALSDDELKLLKAYREMNETDKEFIHMYIDKDE